MISLTPEEIYFFTPTLQELGKKDLPAKAGYKLARMIKLITDEFTIIEGRRNELIKKYGKPQKDHPDQIEVMGADRIQFSLEFKEILSGEPIEFNLEPIDIAIFGEEVKFKPSDIALLWKVFTLNDDANPPTT